jgi:hypothetical protein
MFYIAPIRCSKYICLSYKQPPQKSKNAHPLSDRPVFNTDVGLVSCNTVWSCRQIPLFGVLTAVAVWRRLLRYCTIFLAVTAWCYRVASCLHHETVSYYMTCQSVSTGLHDATSHMTASLMLVSMRTWNLTWRHHIPLKCWHCKVLGVIFRMDVYFHSKTQHTTVKYSQQLSIHVRTIHRRVIGLLAPHNSTSVYSPSLNCYLIAPTIECLHLPL